MPSYLYESFVLRVGESLPVADMERAFLDGERRFFYRFAQRGMCMDGATEIFRAAAEFHHCDGFRNQF